MRTWGGAGVSVLVCTRGAEFEMDWWKFGDVSVETTIVHTFLSAPACTVCTDMVYSKELWRDVTTTAMAKGILRLKTLAFIPSENMIGSIFYVRRTYKGWHVHAMCKCSWSELKLAKHLHTFFVLTYN